MKKITKICMLYILFMITLSLGKNVKANTKVLDRYLKKPKSNSDSYVEFPKEKVKKIKFTINAYYGKNVSQKFIKRI